MSSPSAPQASIVRGLWLSRISCYDKLPVPTCPAWLCTHSPFTGRKKGFWKKHLQSEKKPEREAISVGKLRLQARWTRERMEEHREWETPNLPSPALLWICFFNYLTVWLWQQYSTILWPYSWGICNVGIAEKGPSFTMHFPNDK